MFANAFSQAEHGLQERTFGVKGGFNFTIPSYVGIGDDPRNTNPVVEYENYYPGTGYQIGILGCYKLNSWISFRPEFLVGRQLQVMRFMT